MLLQSEDHCELSARAAGLELHVYSSPKFTATLILFQAARASYSPNGSLSLAFFKRSRNALCLADGLVQESRSLRICNITRLLNCKLYPEQSDTKSLFKAF